jgi:hypothetical protein
MPLSPAKLDANRANAQFSTGPVTPEGKARSAANATRHGFRSQTTLIPGEDPTEFEALLDELTRHFDPADLTEQRAVREMADAEWRLRRCRGMQEDILFEAAAAREPGAPLHHTLQDVLANHPLYAQLLAWESKFERQYERAYASWRRYQSDRDHCRDRELNHVIQRNLRPQPGDPNLDTPTTSEIRTNEPTAPAQRPAAQPVPPPRSIARNAPCPCGSREKYKRCCGKDAPPLLHAAA